MKFISAILVICIVGFIYYNFRFKEGFQNNKTCTKKGNDCDNKQQCCDELSCIQGKCVSLSRVPPGSTLIVFTNGNSNKKNMADIYNYATYNSWTIPFSTSNSPTNNMLNATSPEDSPFVGPVNNINPFSTTAPPTSFTQFGPTNIDLSSYDTSCEEIF